jgi:hypothetical protein
MTLKELIHLIPILEIMTSISFDIVQLFDYDKARDNSDENYVYIFENECDFLEDYYFAKYNLLNDLYVAFDDYLLEKKIQLTKNKQYNIV